MFLLFTRVGLFFCVLVVVLQADGASFYNDWAAPRFSDIPSQSGPFADPDQDGQTNLVEFAFGTDPRVAGDFHDLIVPRFASANGALAVEVLERQGRQPGVQIDLYLSANPARPNWIRPWWSRWTTNSLPS